MTRKNSATQSDILVALCQAASDPEPGADQAPCAGDDLLQLLAQAADKQEMAQEQADAEAAEAAAQKLEASLQHEVKQDPSLSEWAKFIQAKANAPIVALEGPAPMLPPKEKSPTLKGLRAKTGPHHSSGHVTPPHSRTQTQRSKTPERQNKTVKTNKMKKLSLKEMQARSMKVRKVQWVNESQWDTDQDLISGA